MKAISYLATVLALAATGLGQLSCGEDAAVSKPELDAGEADVAYQGPTVNGPIPVDPPQDPPWQEDAGPFVVDTTCCDVTFSIEDQEPAGAVGHVRGTCDQLQGEGLPLAREGGKWVAHSCILLSCSTFYWYEFSWPDGDAGPDAGVVVKRVADDQPKDYDGSGGMLNVLKFGEKCP